VRDILVCRTPALGGELYRCEACGEVHAVYHSCRNRHCPRCQTFHAEEWLCRQRELLLETDYLLATCTLPEELRDLAYSHQRVVYSALMQAAAGAVLDLVAEPRFAGGRTAVLAVLHTWTRALLFHPHVHLLLAEGGLDGEVWRFPRRKRFPLPSYAISYRFRKHLCDALVATGLVTGRESIFHRKWVAHVAKVGSGEQALLYLSRYVFRTAISEERIDTFDGESVTFHWTESATGERREATLEAESFLLRFLKHVLPRGFTRVRYYGLWAPTCREALDTARDILAHHHAALGHERRERVEPTPKPGWPRCPSCGAVYGRPLCRLPRQREPP
jgi:Putative transposase/Transposase zinc-binding domain